MAKKTVALVLATIYFGMANCRFTCALGMSAPAPTVAEQQNEREDGTCHHEESKSRPSRHQGQSPCCMSHFDNAPALLPAAVVHVKAPIPFSILPASGAVAITPLAQLRAFSENHDPPLAVSKVLELSSLSPRAPPSSLVVL
ncbi:MAG: hypothetical protein HY077_03845 [Elusimicrobia bacterium]|nr:hypothetical protein [Elusimicrobiota bacterium]